MKSRTKKLIISLSCSLGSILLVVVGIVCSLGGYFIYVLNSYERIPDNQELLIKDVENESSVTIGEELSITSYNIGFGAYSQDYSFFLDESYTIDGVNNVGKYGTAKSLDEVLFNTRGAISVINALNPDFAIFQEVDTDSTRSHHVNQYDMIKESFSSFDSSFASNFHTVFLPYPLHDMHGASNAGLVTISKFNMLKSTRKQLEIASDLSKLFDLDRCYTVSEFTTSNNKTLVIVNIHMSAYDDGGIRDAQLKQLNDFLASVNDDNHYVIIGGDYNHDIVTYNPMYDFNDENVAFSEYKAFRKPEWLQYFFNTDGTSRIHNAYTVFASTNAPTNRDASVPWEKGATYASTIDGFIVSSNIEVVSIETIVTENGNKGVSHFAYSDHDPVLLKFILK